MATTAVLEAAETGDLNALKALWTNDTTQSLAQDPQSFCRLLYSASRNPILVAFVISKTLAAKSVSEEARKCLSAGAELFYRSVDSQGQEEEEETKEELALKVRVENAIEKFRQGEFLVVFDSKDRENEGDLIIAAEFCTPEKVAFMVRHTSGLICTPVTAARVEQLGLPMMVPEKMHSEFHGTAFTVSIDFRHGTTTGISADDRSKTIRALADPTKYSKDDFVRPGHIFPLRSRDGGILVRQGHTEAATDLCKLAGLYPAAAICEITKLDGSMARMPDLELFAKLYSLTLISIEDLIAYRKLTEGI